MALGPIEDELADLVRGRGDYGDQFITDGIKLFLQRNVVLPKVETDSNEILDDRQSLISTGSGPEWASADLQENPNWVRNRAMNLLNLADYIENREAIIAAKKAAADAAVAKRRDELAAEFTAVNSYNGQLPYTQKLIDRIVELEGVGK